MNITKTLDVANRRQWRAWLAKNHKKEPEIWLIYYRKGSGRKRVPYTDAVEEALCYGWIDSQMKNIDKARFAQRFSPRKPRSNWSQMNKERVRRLIAAKKMTKAGLTALGNVLEEKFVIAPDILAALKKDTAAWKHFQSFPKSYQSIRVGFIEGARSRPAEF